MYISYSPKSHSFPLKNAIQKKVDSTPWEKMYVGWNRVNVDIRVKIESGMTMSSATLQLKILKNVPIFNSQIKVKFHLKMIFFVLSKAFKAKQYF